MRADAADGHAARALDTRDGLRAGRHDAAGAPRQLQNDVPILRDGGDARGVPAEKPAVPAQDGQRRAGGAAAGEEGRIMYKKRMFV